MSSLSLYLHIPFCKKKCNYCDFASFAGKEDLIQEYVDALIEEIKDSGFRNQDSVPTLYIGGGTPTLVAPQYYEKIFKTIRSTFKISPDAEISIEANPGAINKEKLKALRSIGINRLSIGAQSFNDKHLKVLGRIHTAKEIYKGFNDARAAGFNNIGLDLIFMLPEQTVDEWKEDIKQALSLEPEHISTYNLQIEEGTKFSAPGAMLQLPTEDEDVAMYEYAIDTLKAKGYHHYEISNFARPGFKCKHNIVYWENGNYLGIGASASSHINGNRYDNPQEIEEYLKGIINKREILQRKNQPDQPETIFMGLRLLDGIAVEKFKGFEEEVDQLIKDGLLERTKKIKLTHRGLLLANEVFQKFI